jgi:hypothetical protein
MQGGGEAFFHMYPWRRYQRLHPAVRQRSQQRLRICTYAAMWSKVRKSSSRFSIDDSAVFAQLDQLRIRGKRFCGLRVQLRCKLFECSITGRRHRHADSNQFRKGDKKGRQGEMTARRLARRAV